MNLVKCSINIVQREDVEIFRIVSWLVEIVEKHLSHFVNWYGGINGATQATFAHHVWQGPKV